MHIEFKNPWENPEPQGIMVNGKEAITQKSFLMCSNASTPLVIESSGQDHVYVKHLIFQMEMDQKYGEALRATLDDPNGSLYLNKGMYEIALQFLEDQMKAGQGALSLYMLDDKDSAQSFYIRSALAHLQPAVNPQNLGSFCDGLAAVMGRYDASMREGVDGHVLNAAMMNLLRVDCGKTNELIQAGGFYRWQEENKESLRLMAASMKEFEYAALMVSSMMASAAKQGNKERYQEKEGRGALDGTENDAIINTSKGELGLGERKPLSSLNKRQRELLKQLSNPGDTVIIRKKSVSMNDLRQLTNVTGDEFNMFTKGGKRLIIRGDGNVIKVSKEMLDDLVNGTYGKFSGHTHPPGYSLESGQADEPFLGKLGQERSSVWGNSGEGWLSFGNAPWSTTKVREQIRREKMAKFYENQ